MNAYKKFSSHVEDIQKSLDFKKGEAVLMIGAFPEDDELVVGMFGHGLEITAGLCVAFDTNPELKTLVRHVVKAHDLKEREYLAMRQDLPDAMEMFTKCFNKKNRS